MFSFHRDLSMNNITELPADVFKNFPYLEELWVQDPALFLPPNGVLTLRQSLQITSWTFEFVLQKRAAMPFLSAEGR